MTICHSKTAVWLVVCAVTGILPMSSRAWEPNAEDLGKAIKGADFNTYSAELSTWLTAKTPSDPATISRESLKALLDDPVFAKALAQVHFVSKVSGPSLVTAAENPLNRDFLAWALGNTEAMVHCIEGVTPAEVSERREAPRQLPDTALAIWKTIYDADPESKEGVCLKLAIAIAINPPGTSHPGPGQATTPAAPLDRYKQFKAAYENKDMVRGFEELSVWEYGKTVSCNASDEDMVWARNMVNTWRPDLRVGEDVVATTGELLSRDTTAAYSNSFKNVLAIGGMAEPRASWAVFINQAFGVPVVWVSQSGHPCAAYRTDLSDVCPQEGDAWKVAYGGGWGGSTPGQEFYEGATVRCNREEFMLVEKIRWLSWALESPDQATAAEAVAFDMTEAALVSMKTRDMVSPDREPDEISQMVTFEAPHDVGDHYRSRVRGFIVPPKTGEYVFATASDDDSCLFLSSDDSPDNKKLIVLLRGWTRANDFKHKSEPLSLIAGKRYYIESLHREGIASDNLSVAWSGPGIDMNIISGEHLSPYPAGEKGSILRELWKSEKSPENEQDLAASMTKPEAYIQVPPGAIHIEAEAFLNMVGVHVYDCYTGGKQVNFGRLVDGAWVEYTVDIPAAGTYELTLRIAAVNVDQSFMIGIDWEPPVVVKLPNSHGLWATTEAVDLELIEGPQTLRVAAPSQRGVALRWFQLRRKQDHKSPVNIGATFD